MGMNQALWKGMRKVKRQYTRATYKFQKAKKKIERITEKMLLSSIKLNTWSIRDLQSNVCRNGKQFQLSSIILPYKKEVITRWHLKLEKLEKAWKTTKLSFYEARRKQRNDRRDIRWGARKCNCKIKQKVKACLGDAKKQLSRTQRKLWNHAHYLRCTAKNVDYSNCRIPAL